MTTINPYLTFDGNCEQAFTFYKKIFGGEFQTLSHFKDMPPMPGMEIPENQKKPGYACVLTDQQRDDPDGKRFQSCHGASDLRAKTFSLSVSTDNKEEADRTFSGLAEGGKITMPIQNMFWGAYFGMLIDSFGMTWMVNCDAK